MHGSRFALIVLIGSLAQFIFGPSSSRGQTREYIRLGSRVIAIENPTSSGGVTPASASLQPRQTEVFTAATPEYWTLSGSLSDLGSLSTGGPSTSVTYTPPSDVALSSPVTLTATDANNPGNQASATINFVAPPMSTGGVLPAVGGGLSQVFTFSSTDADIAGISTSTLGLGFSFAFLPPTQSPNASPRVNGCWVYSASSGPSTVYLVTDSGAFTASGTIGSGTVLSNSQCSVSLAQASINVSGSAITVSLPVTFASSYGPLLKIWQNQFDTGFSTGFANVGTLTVQAPGWTSLGGVLNSKVSAIANSDGRLQAFVRGSDNGIYTNAQSSPDGGWYGWQGLGGTMNGSPSSTRNADGRLEVFAVGSDGQLMHIWQTSAGGSWSGWAPLGGGLTSDPAVVTNQDGRVEVFAVGTDHAVWHIWQTSAGGSWSSWSSLGASITTNPTVVMNADGRLEVFVIGADNALWHIAQSVVNGNWGSWSSLFGSLMGDPAPVVNQDGRLEVFATGTDSQVWHVWQTSAGGSWAAFAALGGTVISNPAVGVNADGRLDVVVLGTDNALWHIAQSAPNASWLWWETLNGSLAGGAVTVTNSNGRMEAFAEGADQSLMYVEQNVAGYWSPYANLYFSGGSHSGDSFTVWLQTNIPYHSFNFCASVNGGPGGCALNFGATDGQGNWTLSGTFNGGSVGSWVEWALFPGIQQSNSIAFTVSP